MWSDRAGQNRGAETYDFKLVCVARHGKKKLFQNIAYNK